MARITGYKRNINLKIRDLHYLLNDLIDCRLLNIYENSFKAKKGADKEYTSTKLSKDTNFRNAWKWCEDLYDYNKYTGIVSAMVWQRAGFALPVVPVKYQNVEEGAKAWMEPESAIRNDFLRTQVCYKEDTESGDFRNYTALYTQFNSTPLPLLHELCHNLHISQDKDIDRELTSEELLIAQKVSIYGSEQHEGKVIRHYFREFFAEAGSLFFFYNAVSDSRVAELEEMRTIMPVPTGSYFSQYREPYEKLINGKYKSEYLTNSKLVNQITLTPKHILKLSGESPDFYALANRIDTIMYCKAHYWDIPECMCVMDKLICYINDTYDILPHYKNIMNLEIYSI